MKAQQKYTRLHRILHWISALALTVLFITGFLRMKWMSKTAIGGAISSKAGEAQLSDEQVSGIIRAVREPMWEWHEIFANVMILSFLVRIVYMIVKGIRFPNPFKSGISTKERFQGMIYVYFYVFLAISAFTGICIEKELLTDYEDTIESVHKWGLYWVPIFILLHFGGVALAEHSNQKGIASKMIGGD